MEDTEAQTTLSGDVDKRRLKQYKGARSRSSLNKVQRVIKVSEPRCSEGCQEDRGFGWWEDCTHEPYLTEDGNSNLRQVAVEMKVNSQTGLERAFRKGARLPEDVGLKPFCQYRDCWSQNIKFKTRWGDYCSREHAALIILREEEQVVWAPFDEDSKRRRQQISNVVLD